MALPVTQVDLPDCQLNWEYIDKRLPSTTVTSLPIRPSDGQEVYYLADSGNAIWHLRYRSSSALSYKWDVVGGSPIFRSSAQQTDTASGYGNFFDIGLTSSLVAPLSGIYHVIWTVQAFPDGSANWYEFQTIVRAGSNATISGATNMYGYYMFTATVNDDLEATASDSIIPQGSGGYNGSLVTRNGMLTVTPVHVG